MANKVILKNIDKEPILPITRGELVLDSSGNNAFHSKDFIGSDKFPGLMSSDDKSKLDTIEEGALVNEYAFSSIQVTNHNDTNTPRGLSADKVTDTLYLTAGSNIKLFADSLSDTITITNTYSHPTQNVIEVGPGTEQAPKFGGTFSIVSGIASDTLGHVADATEHNVTIPELPNVTVEDKGKTTAANAGNEVVEVVKTLANGTTSSKTNIYVDYTTVEVPTKKYVDDSVTDSLEVSKAMVLKGSKNGSSGDFEKTNTFSLGEAFVVSTAHNDSTLGVLEVGDLVIANKDSASKTTKADWIILQKNVDLVGGQNTVGLIKNGSAITSTTGLTTSPIINGIPYYKDTTYDLATTIEKGLVKLFRAKGSANVTVSDVPENNNKKYAVDMDSSGKIYVDIPWTDTTYDLATTTTSGLIKLFRNKGNNVVTVANASSTDAKYYGVDMDANGKLYVNIPWKDTDTHYTTNIYAGSSQATSNSRQNNPYITIVDDSTYRNQIQIKGSGTTTVLSDANGVITISSADSNTGTVTSITPGEGLLTGDDTQTSITSSGTLKLDSAKTDTLGGIKVASVSTSASLADEAVSNTRGLYAIHIDKNGLGYVALPKWTTNTGTITQVTAGKGLTGGGDSGGISLDVGEGDGISVNADSISLKCATTLSLGGIKVGNRLSIDSNGVLSADAQSFELNPATSSTLGGVKIGTGLAINDSKLYTNGTPYGTCSTSAATNAKTVTLSYGLINNNNLVTGTKIAVKFSYAHTG